MKKILLILVIGYQGLFSAVFAGASPRVEVDVGEDEYAQDVIWVGPGWYYGIWFGDEGSYNNWNRNRHYGNHRYDGHHGGGARGGGGGRGGGERGGGGGHGGGHGGGGRR